MQFLSFTIGSDLEPGGLSSDRYAEITCFTFNKMVIFYVVPRKFKILIGYSARFMLPEVWGMIAVVAST